MSTKEYLNVLHLTTIFTGIDDLHRDSILMVLEMHDGLSIFSFAVT